MFKKGHKINVGRKRPAWVCEKIKQGKLGVKNPNWKNGRRKHEAGYTFILRRDHPQANTKGYIFEHRVIVEYHLGGFLLTEEVVHHINDVKDDNRIENLMVFISQAAHTRHHNNPKLTQVNEIVFDGRKACPSRSV